MTIKVEKISDNLVRETDGIVTTLRCTKCGQKLPLFTWDCPNCTETLVAEEVKVKLETLHTALSPNSYSLRRDRARQRIVEAVIAGLDTEGKRKLEEYEKREDPCQ